MKAPTPGPKNVLQQPDAIGKARLVPAERRGWKSVYLEWWTGLGRCGAAVRTKSPLAFCSFIQKRIGKRTVGPQISADLRGLKAKISRMINEQLDFDLHSLIGGDLRKSAANAF
jgi:hypothetical protein